MSIISQETWDNMPEEEKEKILKLKKHLTILREEGGDRYHYLTGSIDNLDSLFDKKNLQSEAVAEKYIEPMKEHIDKETQDCKWSWLSEDDKEYYQVLYADPNTRKVIKECLIRAWGEHNLQPKPKIRTWEDVDKEGLDEIDYNLDNPDAAKDSKVAIKCQATLRIYLLIELGYGGMVTEEEWKNMSIPKYWITYYPVRCGEWRFEISHEYEAEVAEIKQFIAFHTKQQAEEFMSYESNRKLVEQYNMI